MFVEVKYKDGIFYGKDISDGKWIIIEQSISFIYVKTTVAGGQLNYSAVTFERNSDILSLLSNYLIGIVQDNDKRLDDIYFRTGWYDKRKNALTMLPLAGLLKRYRYRQYITKAEKRRITALCKQLSVSMRNIYRITKVDPLDVMHGKVVEN